jgi:hypothetical protein
LRSLQIKFSSLVVSLLVLACASLAVIATQHERRALEAEVEKTGRALVTNLAGAAKEPLLEVEQGTFSGELTLDRLIEETGASPGVIAVRLFGREGRIAASLDPAERQAEAAARPETAQATAAQELSVRRQDPRRMVIAAPVFYSGVRVGEAEVEFDLSVLVDPIVRSNTQQLAAVAFTVIVLGVSSPG